MNLLVTIGEGNSRKIKVIRSRLCKSTGKGKSSLLARPQPRHYVYQIGKEWTGVSVLDDSFWEIHFRPLSLIPIDSPSSLSRKREVSLFGCVTPTGTLYRTILYD